ncbi:MAG: hypothetical protein WKG07_15425 [Hymenobacter sp.]
MSVRDADLQAGRHVWRPLPLETAAGPANRRTGATPSGPAHSRRVVEL